MGSAYLSPEVLDSKVRYLAVLIPTLYTHSDDGLKTLLRQELIPKAVPLVLDRFENCLLIPLTKYDQVQFVPSEMQKVYSAFSELDNYLEFLSISIKMAHIHMNASNGPVERTIKMVLQMGLRASKEAADANVWGTFLNQYVIFNAIKAITSTYVEGIKQCLQKGVTVFMVAEDIF